MKFVKRCLIKQYCFHPARSKMTGSPDIIQLTLCLSCICYFQPFCLPCSFPLTPDTLFLNVFPSPLNFLSVSLVFLSPYLFSPSLSLILFDLFFSPVSPSSRKAERRMSVLKRQKEECVLKEENTRHYMGAVISVAEHISQERDQLLQMVLLIL